MISAPRSARSASQRIVQVVVAALFAAPCLGPVVAYAADSARAPQADPGLPAFQGAAAARYREILSGLAARNKLDDDAALLERARLISAGLIAVAAQSYRETSGWAWEIHVTSDASTGAFCMAGGKILLGSALVRDLALDDGELAMLLGHEVAHALAGHRREVARESMDSDPQEEVRRVAIAVGQEVEADRIGMAVALRAGWPAASLVSFYDKVAAREGAGTFSTSHPQAASRAALARELAQQLSPPAGR